LNANGLLENFSILSAFATEEGDNGICEPKACKGGRENHWSHWRMIFLLENHLFRGFSAWVQCEF
jgi:hypothetical protein